MALGSYDSFLLRLAPADGAVLWGVAIQSPGGDQFAGLALDGSDEVIVAGSREGVATITATPPRMLLATTAVDAAFIRFRDAGTSATVLEALSLATSGSDGALDVAVGESQRAIVGGYVGSGGATAEMTTLDYAGGTSDAFLWRHASM